MGLKSISQTRSLLPNPRCAHILVGCEELLCGRMLLFAPAPVSQDLHSRCWTYCQDLCVILAGSLSSRVQTGCDWKAYFLLRENRVHFLLGQIFGCLVIIFGDFLLSNSRFPQTQLSHIDLPENWVFLSRFVFFSPPFAIELVNCWRHFR